MNAIKNLVPATLIIAVVAFLLPGCSDNSEQPGGGLVERVVDSVTLSIVENLEEARLVSAEEPIEAEAAIPEMTERESFVDFTTVDSILWAVYDGGVIEYDLSTGEAENIITGERMRAVANHNDGLFVGGDRLYQMVAGAPLPVDESIKGEVTALKSFGDVLAIGTSEALYLRTLVGLVELFNEVDISSIAVDDGGLWIGTNGQGLYRYDGQELKRRYLQRDKTLFDNVTSLATWNDHLYVGTPSGLFVFDGGSWLELREADGLPSDHILSLNAEGWVTLVGTTAGTVSYFNEQFRPVARISDTPATALKRFGDKIIVGTRYDGVLQQSDARLLTLVSPKPETHTGLASAAH